MGCSSSLYSGSTKKPSSFSWKWYSWFRMSPALKWHTLIRTYQVLCLFTVFIYFINSIFEQERYVAYYYTGRASLTGRSFVTWRGSWTGWSFVTLTGESFLTDMTTICEAKADVSMSHVPLMSLSEQTSTAETSLWGPILSEPETKNALLPTSCIFGPISVILHQPVGAWLNAASLSVRVLHVPLEAVKISGSSPEWR